MAIPTDDIERYEFAIPGTWAAALREAAAENAIPQADYSITELDPKRAASQLGFHVAVVKMGLWLGTLIVGQVAKKLIEPTVDKLIQKVRSFKKPSVAKPILILLPNGDIEQLDPFDEEGVRHLLRRLQAI